MPIIVNPATLGGAIFYKRKKRKCFKCKGKGYLGELKWLGNKICDKCGGSGEI